MLLKAGHFSGAYYLAGYSVECALKACIAKQTARYDFPDKSKANDSFVHDLKKLAGVEFDIRSGHLDPRQCAICLRMDDRLQLE